jgi:hypothetical protein
MRMPEYQLVAFHIRIPPGEKKKFPERKKKLEAALLALGAINIVIKKSTMEQVNALDRRHPERLQIEMTAFCGSTRPMLDASWKPLRGADSDA